MSSNNNRDTEEIDEEDIDEDELLAMLSPEEIQELQSEMDVIIAPDERVPVGQRQKDQTEKPPTGSFDHRGLVDYLYWEKESKRMLEEERVPATLLPSEKTLTEEAEKKEKEEAEKKETANGEDVEYVYEVIEVIEEEAGDGEEGEEIIEEIIKEEVEDQEEEHQEEEERAQEVEVGDKTEAEAEKIEELPATTEDRGHLVEHSDDSVENGHSDATDGNHQPPSGMDENKEEVDRQPGTLSSQEEEEVHTRDSSPPRDAEQTPEEEPVFVPEREVRKINKLNIPKLAIGGLKMTARPSGNETNLDTTLDKIKKNNPSVTEVNLNNIENIPKEMLLDYVNAIKKNRFVKTLSIANTGVDETTAFHLANMLRENRSVTTLNIESNFVTGKGIVAIIRCLQFNETLTELRFHNQRHMLGHHAEMEISRLLKANNTLLKMGYHFEQPGPRMVVTNLLTRNLDRQRQVRKEDQKQQQLKEHREAIQMYEHSLNLPPGLLEMLGYVPPLEVLQQNGLLPSSSETSAVLQKIQRKNSPPTEPQASQPRHTSSRDPIPKLQTINMEPTTPLRDVQLKRTPKKPNPLLQFEDMKPDRASFHLRKVSREKDTDNGVMGDDRPNLRAVIQTLRPVPRVREPAKIDLTPRDFLLNQIKQGNVAYLKSVPLPKELESRETSLF